VLDKRSANGAAMANNALWMSVRTPANPMILDALQHLQDPSSMAKAQRMPDRTVRLALSIAAFKDDTARRPALQTSGIWLAINPAPGVRRFSAARAQR